MLACFALTQGILGLQLHGHTRITLRPPFYGYIRRFNAYEWDTNALLLTFLTFYHSNISHLFLALQVTYGQSVTSTYTITTDVSLSVSMVLLRLSCTCKAHTHNMMQPFQLDQGQLFCPHRMVNCYVIQMLLFTRSCFGGI